MSDDKIPKNSATSNESTSAGMKRRDLPLSGSSLLAASVAITD